MTAKRKGAWGAALKPGKPKRGPAEQDPAPPGPTPARRATERVLASIDAAMDGLSWADYRLALAELAADIQRRINDQYDERKP